MKEHREAVSRVVILMLVIYFDAIMKHLSDFYFIVQRYAKYGGSCCIILHDIKHRIPSKHST